MRSIRIHKALLFTLGSLVGTTAALAQTIVPPGIGALSSSQPERGKAVLTGVLNSTGGQNPTVKIRWGDEDRGTAVTPAYAWDNEVTISTNQTAGTFSTTIDIPNLDKIYYFRVVANNAGGAVVSRQLGVVLPNAPVGVANLQGRWSFDGENANDASGAGRNGTAKKLYTPAGVSGMKLWLDASNLSTAGPTWTDNSGNLNHAVKNGSPIVVEKHPGISLMRYTGETGQYHSWTQMTDIRTVFWVVQKTGSNTNMLLLGDSSNYFFHPNGAGAMWHPSLGPVANVRGGTTKINGTTVNGTSTGIPTSLSVISLKTSGNVTASNFADDRQIVQSGVNRVFEGDLGELLLFNTALSDSDIQKIEGYLAHKWGLQDSLPTSHAHSMGAPIASSGTPDYVADTPFGSGKAIDLINGHVEIPTGEAEDIFDAGTDFSVSAWIKGGSKQPLGSIVSKGAGRSNNMFNAPITMWVDASAIDTITSNANGEVVSWQNLVDPTSALEGHSTNKPDTGVTTINGLNALKFVRRSDNNMERVLGKKNGADWNPAGSGRPDDMALIILAQIDTQRRNNFPLGFGWGDHFPWNNGRIYWRFTGGRADFVAFSTGVPTIITMHLSKTDGVQKAFKDGSEKYSRARTDNANYNVGSSFHFPFNGSGNYASDWTVAEMIVTKGYFTHSAREAIEGYLAGKWGLNNNLPSSHSGKDWSDTSGWAINSELSSSSLGTNFPGLNDVSSFRNTTDLENSNSWHHLVVSMSGDTQKLYIDGVETNSQSIAGSISASASALVFGAYDRNSSTAAAEEVKNIAAAGHSGIKLDEVRIYNKGLTASEVTDIYNFGKGDLQKIGGFSTLPTTVTATAGTAFSTTVTADFTNAVYEAYNLPNGLSINSSTGEISGTPTVGGTHAITVSVSGGTGEAPKKAAGTITYIAPTSAPKFGTPGAQNVVGDSALILTEIEQSGASTNIVDFVWDTSDKGTSNLSDWNGSATSVGSGKEGFYGQQLINLTPGETYYYRSRVTMNQQPIDLVSDLKVWLDASDLTSVPNPWVDKSGSGNSPEKKGSGHTITSAAQNGLNVLTFNTANQDFYEKTSSTITDDDQTWLFLVKPLSSQTLHGNASAIFALGGGSYALRFSSGNGGYYRGRALITGPSGWHLNSLWLTHTAGGSSTNKGGVWNLIGLHRIGSTIQLYMNGTTVNSGTASSYTLGSDTYFRIMSGSSNYNIRGDLAEVLAFQSRNDTSREKLEGYLAHKWGLTSLLPSNHTYKTNTLSITDWSSCTILHNSDQYQCSYTWFSIHCQCRRHFRRYAGRIDGQWKCCHHRKILLGR